MKLGILTDNQEKGTEQVVCELLFGLRGGVERHSTIRSHPCLQLLFTFCLVSARFSAFMSALLPGGDEFIEFVSAVYFSRLLSV